LPPVERQVAVQGVRAGLRALLKELGGDDRPTEERPQRRARSIVVAPAVSGMGCSTLTATLARYYQNRGEGVLIFDDREDGLLRLHFQAADSVAIPIMSRDSAPTLAITWFQEPMTRHQMEYRWFLMDTKSITPALVNAPLSPGSCFLVPVLADMRGVKAAVRLSEQLDSYESEQGRRLAFYFVLNQFDRASRLQEEMRQHLMRRLGGRLAPVAIRWAEEVGAALAEGATVLDYAPEAPAAQDFESLGEWLAGLGQ
jgi:cellulose biosynthesis protein BcsQ